MQKLIFISLISVFLFFPVVASADSFFSSAGLGLPQYYISTQSTGMGGAGIGVRQYLALNEMNPAALDLKGVTMISAGLVGESIGHTIGSSSATTRQANAAGFRMAVPLSKNRFAMLFSLKPLMTSRLNVDFKQTIDENNVTRTLDGKGGISSVSLGAQFTIIKGVAVGALFDFYFGTYHELWKTNFDDDTFLNTRENVSSHLYGKGAQFGLYLQPIKALSFGATWSTASRLNMETLAVTGGGKALDPVNQVANYPTSMGLGAAVDLKKFLFAVDVYTQLWNDFKVDDASVSNIADYLRVGAGIQYLDSKDYLASYARRIAFRVGGYYARLPYVDSYGVQASEIMWSLGMGFPFNKNAGSFDFALEFGKRSSSDLFPYSENIYRITASVTSAEKWFVRSY
jgi:hypothetical protein